MASYLSSYFGGGASNNAAPQYGQYQPQYQQYQQTPQQTQSGGTWSNTFSSRIGALRKALTRDNEEDDPENEDCSHVSNVLRAYYFEKGRPFPEWLPPDPKKPAVTPGIQPPQSGQYGNMYSGQYVNAGMPHNRSQSGGKGSGLSDLWDSAPAQTQAQAPVHSLRALRPTAQALRSSDATSASQSGQDSYSLQARLLPSQRAGSYQNIQPTLTAPAAGNPRDRLRARLQGSGSGRSSPANTSQSSYMSQGAGVVSTSASQPWSNDGKSFSHDADSPGYGNASYQRRPGDHR